MCGSRRAWFLAQLKPNSWRIAERNLVQQGFEVFCPLEKVTRRARGKFSDVERPLFPGYVFVVLDAAEGGWHAVNATKGVTRLVSFGRDPAPVPTAIVTSLKQRCDERQRMAPLPTFMPGDGVRLTSGPFAGFVAEVEKIAPDQRVWVLLDLMGARTRASSHAKQLRALSRAAP